jgi:hypothetical protein
VLTRLRYEVRALPPWIGGVIALSVAPALIVLVRGGERLDQAVVAAVVVGSAATALASVDPAAEILAPAPTPLVSRWGARLATITAVTALAWVVVLAAVGWRDPQAMGRLGDRLGELTAVAGLSAAGGAYADRRRLSVAAAALTGPMGALVVSTMAYRFPDLPTIGADGDGSTWAVLAAVAWAVALWERRDPYGFARPRLRR